MFHGPSDQTVGPSVPLPLKMDHPGIVLIVGYMGGPLNQYDSLSLLVSIVKDMDRPAIWSDGPGNKCGSD